MRQLQYLLFILAVLITLVSGSGYDPFGVRTLGTVFPPLSGVLSLVLLGVLLVRTHQLENCLSQTLSQHRQVQEQWQVASQRLEAVSTQATHLAGALQGVQQTVAQNEWLLPGKLLLLQRRHEEAIKVFQDAVVRQPDHQTGRWLLGEALCSVKRYAEGLPHLLAGLVEDDVTQLTFVAQCEQALGRYADAETHLLQLLQVRGETRQEDLVALGIVQGELEPMRAVQTLSQALGLNPYNSAVRYQLIDLETRVGAYDHALELATEGLQRNPADVGCFVSRAEAYFRRGRPEDETHILRDLSAAQAKNRKDYNIYRLRGAVYQRRASRHRHPPETHKALQQAMAAYEEGLEHIPTKFHAHILAAQSRLLLQLKRFDEAVAKAQRAVEHHPAHVSNHLALAFAYLAARQWPAAAQTAERGLPWAGWGGRIWLTAIAVFACVGAGDDPSTLQAQCTLLADELEADARHFALSESWGVIRDILGEVASQLPAPRSVLVTDTVALLEHTLEPEQYRAQWGQQAVAPSHGSV